MNNFTLLKGNVGRDPEVKTTTTGLRVATYSLAVNRPSPKDKEKPITDWFNIIAWGDQAEIVATNVKKGSKLLLTGKFQTRSYDDKNGNKVNVTEFVQDEVALVLTKEKKEDTGSIYSDSELPF